LATEDQVFARPAPIEKLGLSNLALEGRNKKGQDTLPERMPWTRF